jgi:hypothetical protein
MPKIKFSERIKELAKKLHVIQLDTVTEPEECKPIVLIKPRPDVEPPKPVKPIEYDK